MIRFFFFFPPLKFRRSLYFCGALREAEDSVQHFWQRAVWSNYCFGQKLMGQLQSSPHFVRLLIVDLKFLTCRARKRRRGAVKRSVNAGVSKDVFTPRCRLFLSENGRHSVLFGEKFCCVEIQALLFLKPPSSLIRDTAELTGRVLSLAVCSRVGSQ